MSARRRASLVTLMAAALLVLVACGQMGPLTLPQQDSASADEQGEDDDEQ